MMGLGEFFAYAGVFAGAVGLGLVLGLFRNYPRRSRRRRPSSSRSYWRASSGRREETFG